MSFKHIVLFKLKDGVDKEELGKLIDACKNIESVRECWHGSNVSARSQVSFVFVYFYFYFYFY